MFRQRAAPQEGIISEYELQKLRRGDSSSLDLTHALLRSHAQRAQLAV